MALTVEDNSVTGSNATATTTTSDSNGSVDPNLSQNESNTTTQLTDDKDSTTRKRSKRSGWGVKPSNVEVKKIKLSDLSPMLTADQQQKVANAMEYAMLLRLCEPPPSTLAQQPPTLTTSASNPDLDPTQAGLPNPSTHLLLSQLVPGRMNSEEIAKYQNEQQQIKAVTFMCRIYIGSISFDQGVEEIRKVFECFGPIKFIDVQIDPASQRHRGFCFLDYQTPEAAILALSCKDSLSLAGRMLKVGRPSNSSTQILPMIEKLQQEAMTHARIFISCINPELSADDIKMVFEAFGAIKNCQLAQDLGEAKHKGYGYIEYEDSSACAEAVSSMNNFDLGGNLLKVCKAVVPPMNMLLGTKYSVDEAGIEKPQSALAIAAAIAAATVTEKLGLNKDVGNNKTDMSGDGTNENESVNNESEGVDNDDRVVDVDSRSNDDDAVVNTGEIEEENGEVTITSLDQQYQLMQRLNRKSLKNVIVLRNMIGTEDVDDELNSEVEEECTNYGAVKSVYIHVLDDVVKIFVQFEDNEGAQKAQEALNGRWFGGRSVIAEFYDIERFDEQDYSC